MSASSGREDTATVAGSQEVTPNAREPIYMFSVSTTCTNNVETKEKKKTKMIQYRTCMTTLSPGSTGWAVNT